MCASYDKSSAKECAVCLYDRMLGKYSCRFHTSLFLHHCFCWQNENTSPKQMQENTEHCILTFVCFLFLSVLLTALINIIYPSAYSVSFSEYYCLAFTHKSSSYSKLSFINGRLKVLLAQSHHIALEHWFSIGGLSGGPLII